MDQIWTAELHAKVIRIEPQPRWQEQPFIDDDGFWVSRYRDWNGSEGDYDVFEDQREGLVGMVPVMIDGIWYWIIETERS